MNTVKKSTSLRWMVLLSVLINVAVNALSNYFLINGLSIEEITRQYYNMFTPAGFTFSIWGVIYLSYIIYAIYQLLPSQRNNTVHDKLAPGFILANFLGMVWIIVFSYELITVSLVVIISLLVTSFVLFQKVKEAAAKRLCRKAVTIPFSLLFGWISVAMLANFSTWIAAMGWSGSAAEESTRTVVLIAIAIIAAFVVSLKYKDWIYPLVVAWACFGIWSVNREFNVSVAMAAITTGGLILGWDLIYSTIMLSKKSRRVI